MDRKPIGYFAAHRVLKPGGNSYRAVPMSGEALTERRRYMRGILKYTRFRTASNDDLDNMLLYPAGDAYIVQDAGGYDFYLMPGKVSRELAQERKERTLIPLEYKGKMMKDFDWGIYGCDASTQKKTALSFLLHFEKYREKGMGLYIFSNTKGSGKTMLSCILLNEISERYGINSKFISVYDYLDATKKKYGGAAESADIAKEAELLAVDDIGAQMGKEWIDSTFYELVDYRYAGRKPTIYTSNLPPERLGMDERTIDRMERNTVLLSLPERAVRKELGRKEKEAFMKQIGMEMPQPGRQPWQGQGTAGAVHTTDT